jgi:ubiquinone/menaquinone biosynthesis C-methylase UbiE
LRDKAIKEYFNEKAAIWDETAAEKDTTKLEEMARRLAIEPGSCVLDVGTGTGVFVPFLLSRIGGNGRLVCLDFAEEMLNQAKAKGFAGKIEYLCADISRTRLDDETFDTVVCYSSFPHFQDKLRVLSEINRLLKKGGRLFICHTSSRLMINEVHHQIPEVENDLIPDEDEMRQLLTAAGFDEISIGDGGDNYLASATKPG